MAYLVSVVLVALAAVLLVIGFSTANVACYIAAALFSALAVVLLVKRVRANRERIFVTDAPSTSGPQWDRPIARANAQPWPEGLEMPVLGIDNYNELVAAEVLPTLETLSVDELQAVIVHERHGMARAAIIHRAEVLIDLTLGSGSAERRLQNPEVPSRKTGPDLSL
jgi:hypothetical protein